EDQQRRRQEALNRILATGGKATPPAQKQPQKQTPPVEEEASPEQLELMERLGIAATRVTAARAAATSTSASSTSRSGRGMTFGSTDTAAGAADYGSAQERFGNKKAISSDQFFGRGDDEDEAARAERAARLRQFEGARSISSSQYFGREEEEEEAREG